jgi:hypothetical protein
MAMKKKETQKVVTFELNKKPQVYVARIQVRIAGDRLLVDRLTPSGAGLDKKYGETAVNTGDVKKLAISKKDVFERAKYRDAKGRDAFPAGGIRSCIRDGAVELPELSKAGANRAINIVGDMLTLNFKECRMREDVGRNSGPTGAPRLVIRPEYIDWSIDFEIDLLLNAMNPTECHSLIDMAGRVIGIGNWRPGSKKGGSHGTFTIKKFEVK